MIVFGRYSSLLRRILGGGTELRFWFLRVFTMFSQRNPYMFHRVAAKGGEGWGRFAVKTAENVWVLGSFDGLDCDAHEWFSGKGFYLHALIVLFLGLIACKLWEESFGAGWSGRLEWVGGE